jgi:hypothetical protein
MLPGAILNGAHGGGDSRILRRDATKTGPIVFHLIAALFVKVCSREKKVLSFL